jgi:hypothetical protein
MIVDVITEVDIVAYGQFECHMQLATRCVPSKSANGADNGLLQALQRGEERERERKDVRRKLARGVFVSQKRYTQ